MARILVAEDEWLIAASYEAALGRAGHVVASAADGREALACAAEDRFDLVLTDQMMPRLDGLGFLGELRRLPGYGSVPAILATALPAAILPAHGQGLYQAVLSKPFRDEALLALVAGLLPGDRGQPGSSGISAS